MRVGMMAAVLGMVLAAPAARAQEVAVDYDRGTDFTRYATYAWTEGTPVEDALNHRRIVAAVDSQLAKLGLVPAGPGVTPDLLVAYHAQFARDVAISAQSMDWGGVRRNGNRQGSARLERTIVGTLGLVLIDPATDAPLWRAATQREVDLTASPAEREKQIAKAVERMLKRYPIRR